MLEKVNPSGAGGAMPHLHFRNISPDSSGVGVCYVRSGQHKFTRTDKPFIVLNLQDSDNVCIPGYIFDVENFKLAGLELTQVQHSLVKIAYKENYLPRYGLTVIIDKLELIVNPGTSALSMYVGSAAEAKAKFEQLLSGLSSKLGLRINLPFTISTLSHVDYEQGEIGGLTIHYWDMFKLIEVYSTRFSEEDQSRLWGTFVLYIFAHSNYLSAEERGEADISLVSSLTSMLQTYVTKLKVGSGALEVVHILFGYQPKDIFVRLVVQASEEVTRTSKEINLYKTLPDTREGNAGYGIIRRYRD